MGTINCELFKDVPKTITFECDEVTIKSKSLETKWLHGVPLNFEDYDHLIFSGNGKTYKYTKSKL